MKCEHNRSSEQLTPHSKVTLKAGFHMIADDRGSQIAESSAIIWKHTSAIVCDRL